MSESKEIIKGFERMLDDSKKQHIRQTQMIIKQRDQIKSLKANLAMMGEALRWYSTATYPDDGSGRPPENYQRRALKALTSLPSRSKALLEIVDAAEKTLDHIKIRGLYDERLQFRVLDAAISNYRGDKP